MDLTGLGSVFDLAKSIVDRIWPPEADPNQKIQAQLLIQQSIEQRETQMVEAQKSIIVSEMNQGDSYTKRARPTIVYAGLAFIFLVNVAFPLLAWITLQVTGKPMTDMPQITLPGEFWAAWGGVCSIWVIGRSAEKRGVSNHLTKLVNG